MKLSFLKKHSASQSGFTMVEIAVALGVGSVLSLAMSELIRQNTVNNRNVGSSITWGGIVNEMNLILGNVSGCQGIFSSKYPTGSSAPTPYTGASGTTRSAFPNGTELTIQRPGTTVPFQAGYIEKSPIGGGGIKILSITSDSAVDISPTVVQFNIRIQAQKVGSASSTRADYDQKFPITIMRSISSANCPGPNCTFNSIQNCTSSFSNLVGRDACESLGGVWNASAPPGVPNCAYLSPPPSHPASTPYLSNTSAYQNLCPAGQALSGIDLSTGKAVAACTDSNPLSNSINNCIGGVLTWQGDTSILAQGRYICKSLPGSTAGGNVPTGTTVSAACVAKQHLYWNGSEIECRNDTYPPGPSVACAKWQIPIWNGTGYTCQAIIPNPSTDGTGDCQTNKFLQWDATTASYRCAKGTSIAQCASNQLLSWNGSDFECVYLDSGGKNIVPNCPAPFRLYYSSASHQFSCISPLPVPPTPPYCAGYGQALQWTAGNFRCVDRYPINYNSCSTVYGDRGEMIYCPPNTAAVGFCASGGAADCLRGGVSKYYTSPDWEVYSALKCCTVNSGTGRWISGAGGARSGDYSWGTFGYVSGNAFGNLAKCESYNSVVTGMCSSDGDRRCSAGSAAVSVACSSTGGTWTVNSYTTQQYGRPTAIKYNGCRIVHGTDYGEWAHCSAGEVLVGICGSGSNKDCEWASPHRDHYNQAMCCPIK